MFSRSVTSRLSFAIFFQVCVIVSISMLWKPVDALAVTDYPVIFVHGINSDSRTFQTMIQHLDRTPNGYYTGGRLLAWTITSGPLSCSWNGDFSASQPNWQPVAGVGVPEWKRYFAIDFSDSSNLTFREQAIELKTVINCVKAITGQNKVILVAHSMGGLASRYYLQSLSPQARYEEDVAKLVTIGTPHDGANSASFEKYYLFPEYLRFYRQYFHPYSVAAAELIPGSSVLKAMNRPVSNEYLLPQIPYIYIRGLMYYCPWEGDCIVELQSQSLASAYKATTLEFATDYKFYVSPCPSFMHPTSWETLLEVHSCETQDMGIIDKVDSEIQLLPLVAQATTGSFSSLTTTSVTLNGSVYLRGYISAQYVFEWGYNDAVSNSTPLNTTTTTNSEVAFSARIAGLTPGTTISYRVKLTPTAGTPTLGDIRYVQIPAVTPSHLPAPILTNPSNGITGQPERPVFQWSAVANATSYRILVARNASDLPTDPDTADCPGCVINMITADTALRPSGGA